ncbi:MAG: pyridoxamine 5'-phosphate oxidase family protein [Candidatus Bathyarchaeota archaeon]|jgi:nitroimidazol reductase NimA-like FMN-containing flavoprotein (pyridoxamine 5'-phosphate oxidase superfamily)
MKKAELEKLVQEQMLCRIAFKGDKYPYMAPFQYVLMNGSLYFHFTDYGKKMRLLESDKRVCVEIEKYKPDLSEYNFVVLRGELEVVQDPDERARAITRMAEDGKHKLSINFLAAHGFEKEDGWTSFTPEKKVVIIKLTKITEEIGLKSPE